MRQVPDTEETNMLDNQQLQELLLQSLEHERGGVKVYETALKAAVNDDLRKEWTEYLSQTRKHVQILEGVLRELEIDAQRQTPGCEIVRSLGESLVAAMTKAQQAGNPAAAQLVACECVVIAETKDHMDWELLGKCAAQLKGKQRQALEEACRVVEDEEDEHLYHSTGWTRELWLESLGLEAVLPPPEEQKDVKTAMAAAKAKQDSERSRARS
jgi:rubrerythrin